MEKNARNMRLLWVCAVVLASIVGFLAALRGCAAPRPADRSAQRDALSAPGEYPVAEAAREPAAIAVSEADAQVGENGRLQDGQLVVLTGRVVDADGRVISGGLVEVGVAEALGDATTTVDSEWAKAAAVQTRHTTTDSLGTFRLETPFSQRMLLAVRATGFCDYNDSLLFSEPVAAVAVGTLVLARGFVLRGTVVSPGGSPVAGAEVFREGEGFVSDGYRTARNMTHVATTGASGSFQLTNVPLGGCALELFASGHVAERFDVPIDRPEISRTFMLRPEAIIDGRLSGEWTGPLSIHVECQPSHNMLTREFLVPCSNTGSFQIRGIPRSLVPFKLRAYAANALTSPHPFASDEVLATGGEVVTLQLSKLQTFNARVIDAHTQRPLDSVEVSAWGARSVLAPSPVIKPAGDGRYLISVRALSAGVRSARFLEFSRYGHEAARVSLPVGMNSQDLGVVSLVPMLRARLHVSDRDGRPVCGAQVSIEPNLQEWQPMSNGAAQLLSPLQALTSIDGVALLCASMAIPYKIVVTHDNYAPLEVHYQSPLPDELKLVIEHGARARVCVAGREQNRVEERVAINCVWSGPAQYERYYKTTMVTDRDGCAVFSKLGLGWYEFTIAGTSISRRVRVMTYDDELGVSLKLRGDVVLRGRITERGRPAAAVSVLAGGGVSATTDLTGTYELCGLRQSIATVSIRHPQWGFVDTYRVDLTARYPRLDVDLDPIVVSGTVHDTSGSPVVGAAVTLGEIQNDQVVRISRGFGDVRIAHTDWRGCFELAPIQRGRRYGLVIRAKQYLDVQVANVGEAPVAVTMQRASRVLIQLGPNTDISHLWVRAVGAASVVSAKVASNAMPLELSPGEWRLELLSGSDGRVLDSKDIWLKHEDVVDVSLVAR